MEDVGFEKCPRCEGTGKLKYECCCGGQGRCSFCGDKDWYQIWDCELCDGEKVVSLGEYTWEGWKDGYYIGVDNG